MEKTIIQENKQDEKAYLDGALKNIFIDMFKYMPSKLIGLIGNILIIPIYTSLLKPEEYGLYSIAIATLSFLCIIFFDWIGTAGLRFFRIHQITNEVTKYFSSLLTLLVINLSLMFLLTNVFKNEITSFFKLPDNLLFYITLLIIPVSLRSLLFQILRAQIKPSLYTISTILNQFTTIALAIFFMKYLHWGAYSILAAMAISIACIDFALILNIKLFKNLKFERVQGVLLGSFCRYGTPLAAASLSMWIMTQSNKFIMQKFQGSFYNGIIGVSYNMTYSIFLTIFAVIMIAAMPRIINMYEQKLDVRPVISKLSGYFIAITIPFILFISLYADTYVRMMTNDKFGQAVELVPLLLISTFFVGLADYTTIQYHLTKKTYIDTIIRLTPGIIGLLLNIKFIPMYPDYALKITGYTTILMNALYVTFSLLLYDKTLKWILPKREILFTFLSLLPSSALMYLLKTNNVMSNVWQLITILLTYFAIFHVLRQLLPSKKVEI